IPTKGLYQIVKDFPSFKYKQILSAREIENYQPESKGNVHLSELQSMVITAGGHSLYNQEELTYANKKFLSLMFQMYAEEKTAAVNFPAKFLELPGMHGLDTIFKDLLNLYRQNPNALRYDKNKI